MNRSPLTIAVLATLLVPAAPPALAGDLDPPTGPIAPTMKPLDAIEPRICVNDLPGSPEAVHLIGAPGSYYLTADIAAGAGQSAILVALPPGTANARIVIDLGSFSISGTPTSIDGIRAVIPPATPTAVVIIGALTVLGTSLDHSFDGLGGDAIHIENADDVQISSLGIRNCGDDGVEVLASKRLFVGGLSVADCSGDGLCSIGNPGDSSVVVIGALTTLGGNLNTTFNSSGADGLHIENADSVHLGGLDVRDCLDDGVEVLASKKLFVGGLAITNCGGDGMTVSGEEIYTDEYGRIKVRFCAGNGMTLTNVRECAMANVSTSENGGAGVSMSTPLSTGDFRWRLRSVDSVVNELQGIVVLCSTGSTTIDIDECSATGNGGNGIDAQVDQNSSCWIRVSQVHANDNGGGASSSDPGHGIVVSGIAAPTRGGGAGGGGRMAIEYDTGLCNGNLADGLRVETSLHDTAMAIIRKIGASDNGGDGVHADVLSGSLTIEGASSTANTGNGYTVQYRETDFNFVCRSSTASGNGADGFHADSPVGLCGPVHATDCGATGNTGAGFNLLCTAGGDIRRCEARANTGLGFNVVGLGHVVVGNTAGGNSTGDYAVALPGNALGPIVTESDISTSLSPHANYRAP